MDEKRRELEGIILDIDYTNINDRSIIRLTLKQGESVYTLYDYDFHPYFYIVPHNETITKEMIAKVSATDSNTKETITIKDIEEKGIKLKGSEVKAFKISVRNTRHVSKMSEALAEFGTRYEYDILFWKRYLIDKEITPLAGVYAKVRESEGRLIVEEIKKKITATTNLTHIAFDIETYNPVGAPRLEKDPILMISYVCGDESGVLTTKKINRKFVKSFDSEAEMIKAFVDIIKKANVDIITGYNSSNFDIPYLIKRASVLQIDLDIDRYGEGAKVEHHGLIESTKIPGRINIDIYNVAKFVSIVGASDKLIRANRFTLSEVYAAITGSTKKMVDRINIWQIWNGSKEEIEELADYSLADSMALNELYNYFMPLEIELAKVTGTTLAEVCVSTTGQLVEYLLMKYAYQNNELIPNKPSDVEIDNRTANPIEGAYVKTPEAGVYKDIVVYDFRGLYPSIIIAYNIDPSSICKDCSDYYESPTKARFVKEPKGIIPKALKILVNERSGLKKAFKKDPNNIQIGARSQALKILANSFYGYMGYARSRWYSRDCAASVTAFGREYIAKTMESAEASDFKVLYGDTDSIFLLKDSKPKEEALNFLSKINKALPESMELELEDFYVSGVFVGKRGEDSAGAKKKYALLSETGRIKIRGFELVRRDWSNISRETQRKVLETILKEGDKAKAIEIVKDVIKKLSAGEIKMSELVIRTQLRKKIDSYDSKSPELAAAKKAIKLGVKKKSDLEGATIGYVVTKSGSSISDKAEIEELAKDYDPDYYINHQVIPATLKILKELGVKEEELRGGGSQKRL